MNDENLTYEKASAELTAIASDLESESISVDILAEKVKRMAFLLEWCKSKLANTQNDINNIISEMDREDL
jgi:exodeoxyribonuclease VII small subunit